MSHINAGESLDLGEVQAECLQRPLELAGGSIGNLRPRFRANDMQSPSVRLLLPPAMYFHFNELR